MDKLSSKWIVTHVLTERCNLNCCMCFQSSLRKKRNKELSLASIESFYRRHQEAIFAVNITGGEPFFRSDCIELIEKLDEMGLIVSINTNGTLITPQIVDRLARLTHLRSINISIDGPKEIHEAIRQQKGIFDKTINNIALLREKLGANILQINIMIMPEIVPILNEHVSYLKTQGIKRIELIFPGSYSQKELNRSAAILKSHGFDKVVIDTADEEVFRHLTVESVQAILAVVQKHPELRIKVIPKTFLNKPQLFLEDELDNYHVNCTKIRRKELRISGSGQIILCDTLRIPLARCEDIEQLDDILCSPAFIEIKEAIHNGLPCCKRCCKSMSLEVRKHVNAEKGEIACQM